MSGETDLRVQKTRRNIRGAFIQLIREKPLGDISVADICHLALCSRNTFYHYYPGKEAVLEELTETCVSEIINGARPIVENTENVDTDVIMTYIENIADSAHRSRELLSLLLRYGNNDISLLLTDAVYRRLKENTRQLAPGQEKRVDVRFYCRYIAGGIVSFIVYWAQNPQLSRDDAASLLQSIHGPVIRKFMEIL